VAGPTVVALDIGDPPSAWAGLGFTVAPDGVCRVGAVELRLGADGRGIVGWALGGDGIDGDVDGIRTRWAAPPSGPPGVHPNTALAVDHVVVRSADPRASFAALEAVGMTLRREHVAGSGAGAVVQGFFRHGEAIVEVVGPPRPTAAAPSRLWGLTITVADLDECVRRLGPAAGDAHEAVQAGRRIAAVRRAAGLGAALAFMSP